MKQKEGFKVQTFDEKWFVCYIFQIKLSLKIGSILILVITKASWVLVWLLLWLKHDKCFIWKLSATCSSFCWKWKEERKQASKTLLFVMLFLAKMKWQIVINLEENKLMMFVSSQAQLSFDLDNDLFTHSQSSSCFLWYVVYNQQTNTGCSKLPIISPVQSWGKVPQHATALEMCRFVECC